VPLIVIVFLVFLIAYLRSWPWAETIIPILTAVSANLAAILTLTAVFTEKGTTGQRAGVLFCVRFAHSGDVQLV